MGGVKKKQVNATINIWRWASESQRHLTPRYWNFKQNVKQMALGGVKKKQVNATINIWRWASESQRHLMPRYWNSKQNVKEMALGGVKKKQVNATEHLALGTRISTRANAPIL